MAGNFRNDTTSNKFVGEFTYNELDYEYVLYLPRNPEQMRGRHRKQAIPNFTNPEEREEVIRKFGNRMQLTKDGVITHCLEIDETTVTEYMDNNYVSAYVIVNQKGSDETASGTLQIHDWCATTKKRKRSDGNEPRPAVWINDVCRILGTGPKSEKSPVDALFFVMEQLTVQNMNQNEINLFVDTTTTTNKDVLKRIYSNKYGFIENSEDNADLCNNRPDNVKHLMVMRKTGLVDASVALDFSYLKLTNGGKRMRYKTQRKRNRKRIRTKKRKLNTFKKCI
jgi:hypothetical protein